MSADLNLHPQAEEAARGLVDAVVNPSGDGVANPWEGKKPDPRDVSTESFVAARAMVELEYGDQAVIEQDLFYDRHGNIFGNVTRNGKWLDTVYLGANKVMTARGVYKSPEELKPKTNQAWEEALTALDNRGKA